MSLAEKGLGEKSLFLEGLSGRITHSIGQRAIRRKERVFRRRNNETRNKKNVD